ncbi:MAG: thiamine-monophosphate kinase [Candidatus Heimdallarchaeota archaeon]|nr:thiamine-monophosphate kinase [Candidatus Heimdallarchaeota archaeon]
MDEHKLLDKIGPYLDSHHRNGLPHPDDAVAIPIGDRYLVVNTDAWVASTDRPPGLSNRQCGYRAAVNAISDVLCKGCRPKDLIVSLSTNAMDDAEEVLLGIIDACTKYDINYLGGDLNKAQDLVIDVTVMGLSDTLVTRSGAKNDEYVYWLGPSFGSTAAALGILLQNFIGDELKAIKIMAEPELFYDFLEIIENNQISASMDCSDGLALTLHAIADLSGIGIKIDNDALITDEWIESIASKNSIKLHDLLFFGGEELGIVFTSPDLIKGTDLINLGRTVNDPGVFLDEEPIPNRGWIH